MGLVLKHGVLVDVLLPGRMRRSVRTWAAEIARMLTMTPGSSK